MGGGLFKIKENVDEVTKKINDVLVTVNNTVNNLQHDTSGTMANIANECFESLRTIRNRVDHTTFLLSNAVLAILAAIALGLLLHLTHFSPFLRTVIWVMYAGLCLHMLRTYLRHSRSSVLPASSEQTTSIQHKKQQIEVTIAESGFCSEVKLIGFQLIDEDLEIVVKQAIIDKQCKQLRLGWNRLTSTGASILADALRDNKTMEQLSLWNNRMGDLGVNFLCKTLSNSNNTLERIDLSENDITDEGALNIAQMLMVNTKLTHLSLTKNKITDQGVKFLADTLQDRNHTLKALSLTGNKSMGDSSVDSLLNILKNNRSLKKLWVNDCNLSKKGQEKLKKATKSKQNFTIKCDTLGVK